MRVIILNKKQLVPYKELGDEWMDLAVWWPDHVLLWGKEVAGRVLLDEANRLAVIPVVKFKTTLDTVSIRAGLEWLEAQGYKEIELVSTEQMVTYPVARVRKKSELGLKLSSEE